MPSTTLSTGGSYAPLFNSDLRVTIDKDPCPSNGKLGNPCPDDLNIFHGGRSTVLVTTIGEESFDDENGNGLWDLGEAHADLPEAFVDHNENGVYDGNSDCTVDETPEGRTCASGLEETYVDFNENGKYDDGNNIYNGTLCPLNLESSGACTRELVNVRADGVIVMSETGGQRLVLLDVFFNVVNSIPDVDSDVTYHVFAADQYNNLPPEGAVLSAVSDSCEIVTEEVVTIPNSNATGAFGMVVKIVENDILSTGILPS